jgi:hypothetical protein
MKRLIAFATIAVCILAVFVQAAPAPDIDKEALAILDKALEAHGGAKKLDKLLVEMVIRETPSKVNDRVPKTVEVSWKPPDRLRVYSGSDRKNECVWIFNGERAWKIDARKIPIDLIPRDSDLLYGAAKYVTWGIQLARYKSEKYKLSLLKESAEGDQKSAGIRASPEKITKVPVEILENAMREDRQLAESLKTKRDKERDLERAKADLKNQDGPELVKKLTAQVALIDREIEERRKKLRPRFEQSLLNAQGQETAVDLFFDSDTKLIIKRSFKCVPLSTGETVQVEILYEDYEVLEGVRYPRKVTTLWDGKKVEEAVVTQFKITEKIDDAIFDLPK